MLGLGPVLERSPVAPPGPRITLHPHITLHRWWHGSLVEAVVNWWLQVGSVREVFRGLTGRYNPMGMSWEPPGPWTVIGAQLVMTVRREARRTYCEHCGKEINRSRRPRADRQHWCHRKDCRRERDREAQRRCRARKAGKL